MRRQVLFSLSLMIAVGLLFGINELTGVSSGLPDSEPLPTVSADQFVP